MKGINLYYIHDVDGHLRKVQINDRNLKNIITEQVGLDMSGYTLDKIEQTDEVII